MQQISTSPNKLRYKIIRVNIGEGNKICICANALIDR
jgi:hypothetical protein